MYITSGSENTTVTTATQVNIEGSITLLELARAMSNAGLAMKSDGQGRLLICKSRLPRPRHLSAKIIPIRKENNPFRQ